MEENAKETHSRAGVAAGESARDAAGPAGDKKLREELLAAIQESAEWRLNDAERAQRDTYAEQIKFSRDYLDQHQSGELSESEIDALVEASIKYKCEVASISSDGERIYLATGAAK